MSMMLDLQRGLEPGIQPFKVTNIESKPGPSGFPTLTVSLLGIGKMNANFNHTEWVSLSPKAAWKKNQFFDSLSLPANGKINILTLIGKTCWGDVQMQFNERRGKDEPRVNEWVVPPPNAEDFLASEEEMAGESQELDAVVANTINELNGATDDDIPF